MWRTAVLDAVLATLAGLVGYVLWFEVLAADDPRPLLWEALLVPVVWTPAMVLARTYEERFLWIGVEEYRRVLDAAVAVLAVVATVSWGLQLEVARGLVVVTLPLATILTLLGRVAHRHWLRRERQQGQNLQTTLLVGSREPIAALDEQLQRSPHQGYRVIGCCLPASEQSSGADAFNGLPVLGGVSDVADVVQRFEVDTVAVLPGPEIHGGVLRRLGWQLEDTEAELLLAPAVTDVVGPRVHIRPVAGLPLLHVERPELTGVRRVTKDLVDRSVAALGLLLLAPALLAVAVAVRLDSPGPVLFRQERVGRCGTTFTMLKFRSMVQDAPRLVEQLAAQNQGNGVLFKMRSDPRVTRVGRVLRRYSIDELPQLINVLRGDMSLVGPRPPLAKEVEQYGVDMHRRFLVKPGLTGLWQVSGRSDLSWDDSVRIDVRYVENWSLALDLMILAKTAGAVLRGAGAY
ncbi:sugar transferase [Geodermatophilus telluris]|uniref:sugar transferase n=1 Tax=Geodermatophilus telluris TaxID=1190417 RepID=UPI001FDF6824|nr:sugar transferase [Geodermatophilus telluris]